MWSPAGCCSDGEAEGAALVRALAAGLVTPPTMPAKLGMLANELTMLSKVRAAVLAAASCVDAEFATVLAAPAKLGI